MPIDSPASSAPPPATPGKGVDPRLGSVLAERYRIHSLLGEGGMGKVYFGEHILMRKKVAIKVLHRELIALIDIVKRFEREAMAAANIDHPNVAGATDFGRLDDGSVFLVLEYVQGTSLRSEIADGAFGLVRALHVARQIASALAAAHRRGIVHRDLKPENVMLVERAGDPDFVKVLDFGIAKMPVAEGGDRGATRPGQVITKVGMVFGTPEYMAPEQALGQDVDPRADQYALGVILYEMLTGYRPYKSQSAVEMLGEKLQNPVPRVSERCPEQSIPGDVDDLVGRLLAVDRNGRYEDCQAVVDVIETLLLSLQPAVLMRGSRPDASTAPLEVPASVRNVLEAPVDFDVRALSLESMAGEAGEPRRRWSRLFSRFARRQPRLSLQLGGALLGGLAVGATAVAFSVGKVPSKQVVAASAVSTLVLPTSVPAVVDPPTQVSASELARARAEGLDALRGLRRRFPSDVTILVEIGKTELSLGDCAAALQVVSDALVLDVHVSENAEVATLLWKTVQKRECAEGTFALLAGPMGARGQAILRDLSTTAGVKNSIQVRANRLLTR